MHGRGYSGEVTLRSLSGEIVTIYVPGRHRNRDGSLSDESRFYHKSLNRQNRRFRRLLSADWKVVAVNDQPVEQQIRKKEFEADYADTHFEEIFEVAEAYLAEIEDQNEEEEGGEAGEEEKKDTSLVIGTTESGDASHGGKHASQEVEDSPNKAKRGKHARGSRGGQKKRTSKSKRRSEKNVRLKVQLSTQSGGGAVYAPQPLEVTPELLASAEESAELLAELVGKSQLKLRQGVSVNAEKLLVALETGDDPLPPLEDPDERPKLKILVTPDTSGSTQNWNGLGQAWALHLSNLPEVDVIYFVNFNGTFWDVEEGSETQKLIESVDVILYLGDGDGKDLCKRYASFGAIVVAMDTYCANDANPRLKTEKVGQGVLHWVDRVSAKIPSTWAKSIALCLGK